MTKVTYDGPEQDPIVARTIVLSAQDVGAAERLLALIAGIQSDRPDAAGEPGRTALLEVARKTFVDRRRRLQHFSASMFSDQAWDILLALYITDQSGPRHTIGGITAFSGAPKSTALRWLGYLEEHQLVERQVHPTDIRASYVSLSDLARQRLDAYFGEVLTSEN